MALNCPGVPSKGTPRSRARTGFRLVGLGVGSHGCNEEQCNKSTDVREHTPIYISNETALANFGGMGFAVLRTASALHANRHVDQAERGRRDAGNAAGLADGDGANALEGFAHLAGEAADDAVVDPVGNGDGFGGFELVDGLALLVEIAGELDFGFDGAGFVAQLRAFTAF